MNCLTLISSRASAESDNALCRLAELLGVETAFHEVSYEDATLDHLRHIFENDRRSLALSLQTLDLFFKKAIDPSALRYALLENSHHIFMYGKFQNVSAGLVNWLSGGIGSTLPLVINPQSSTLTMGTFHPICRELAGLSSSIPGSTQNFAFAQAQSYETNSVLMSFGNLPSFIRVPIGGCEVFLTAIELDFDLDSQLDSSSQLREFYPRLLPPLMFIYHAFPLTVWHNPQRYAALIIDDPLLTKRYGFLKYNALLDCLNSHNFSATIAFIPWNYQRTDYEIAQLFLHNSNRLSICIHGCDHTGAEFGLLDQATLLHKVTLASQRMRRHQETTGVPFDDVMVFPQGHFSQSAMATLKKANYLGAVNSNVIPVDYGEQRLTISDLLDLAVTKYSGFPLFLRHYPEDFFDMAVGMFLGKPAFVVAHHGDFKNGFERFCDIAYRINAMGNNTRWSSLGEILRRCHLEREKDNNEIEVKLYTNSSLITNTHDRKCHFRLIRSESTQDYPRHALLNGKRVPITVESGQMKLSLELTSNEEALIEMRCEEVQGNFSQKKDPLGYGLRVFLRRCLSELRDNHISQHEALSRLVNKIRKK